VRALARTAPAPERAEFAVLLAAAYARIGAVDTAVRLLEEQLGAPAGGWTAPGFAAHPRLRALHREPAFARLRRAYPTR
jgi:hypothetical protein